MKYTAYRGTDIDKATSLLEYGFLAKQRRDRDFKDEWFVLYMMDQDAFGTGHIREHDLDELARGNDWANEKDIKSMFDSLGIESLEEWLELSFVYKLSDLIGHFGYENIMGTDYYPMTRKEACKRAQIRYEDYYKDYEY